MRRGKITRMDKWDIPASRPRLKGGNIPLCDLNARPALHRLGKLWYVSHFRRTKVGTPFSEIKQSQAAVDLFADAAVFFLDKFINNTEDWAIVTTPRRRHTDGFHFASEVCRVIAKSLSVPFYADAAQCVSRDRLAPEFHLLRPIKERRIIIYDDIITTGATLTATAELFADRDFILNVIGINNR